MIEGWLNRITRLIRSHERHLAALCFASLVALFLVVGVPPVRRAVLVQVENLFEYRDAQWVDQIKEGQALLDQEQFAEAQAHFTKLDKALPATQVKHAAADLRRDLLKGLGASALGLGKKRRALEAYQRLIDFDPRDYQSHVAAAQAALHFKELQAAGEHLSNALGIHPNHEPSAHQLSTLRAEGGDFAAATEIYETFLNAYQIHAVTLRLGAYATEVRVPVDGRFHTVRARLDPPAAGKIAIDAGAFAATIDSVSYVPALTVGSPKTSGLNQAVQVRLRVFKPVTPEYWNKVQQAYRNRLDWAGLSAARTRTSTRGATP